MIRQSRMPLARPIIRRCSIELLDLAGDEFDLQKVLDGELTPMFFGSAMTNFGVRPFLEKFLELSPAPQPRKLKDGSVVLPDNENFSAFIFKIQANMNPAHRDRISFMRICSGKFEKGMSVWHLQGNHPVKLSQPQQFMAQERTTPVISLVSSIRASLPLEIPLRLKRTKSNSRISPSFHLKSLPRSNLRIPSNVNSLKRALYSWHRKGLSRCSVKRISAWKALLSALSVFFS